MLESLQSFFLLLKLKIRIIYKILFNNKLYKKKKKNKPKIKIEIIVKQDAHIVREK